MSYNYENVFNIIGLVSACSFHALAELLTTRRRWFTSECSRKDRARMAGNTRRERYLPESSMKLGYNGRYLHNFFEVFMRLITCGRTAALYRIQHQLRRGKDTNALRMRTALRNSKHKIKGAAAQWKKKNLSIWDKNESPFPPHEK